MQAFGKRLNCMRKLKFPSLMIVMSALALAACGGGETDKATKAETEVMASVAKATAGAVVGQATGFGVSTADLPPFAEIIPGGKVIHNMKIDNEGKVGGSVSLTSDKTPDEIVAFYKASMEKNGLKIGMENAGGQMVQIMSESEDKTRSLMVMIVVDDQGGKSVNLVHSRPKT
jgi:hypothetical protein